jgi:hypothetical protein
MALLLIARGGMIGFTFRESPSGIINFCSTIGYPKQQDYFWYGAMLAFGVLGMAGSAFAWSRLRRRGSKGFPGRWAVPFSILFHAVSTYLLFSARAWATPATAVLLLATIAIPWCLREWYIPEAPAVGRPVPVRRWWAWATACAVVAAAWTWDGCFLARWIDGYHEGSHLMMVQAYLSGDWPGVDVKAIYGPLYHYSMVWWMKLRGFTVSSEREYFVLALAAGTAVHLILVRAVCRSLVSLACGTWLMLTLTNASALGSGSANALRTAVPLAGLVLWWLAIDRGDRRLAVASGVLASAGLLYSQEYGGAGVLSCLVMAGMLVAHGEAKAVRRLALPWFAAALLGGLAMLLAAYQGSFFAGLWGLLGDNFASSRLQGHDARPFPSFPWYAGIREFGTRLDADILRASVWFPGILCVLAAGWLAGRSPVARSGRHVLLGALTAFCLLAQLPVLVRPAGQMWTSSPAFVLMLALFIDLAGRRRGFGGVVRNCAVLAVVALVGFSVWKPMMRMVATRYQCDLREMPRHEEPFARLGRTMLSRMEDDRAMRAVVLMGKWLKPGERIYLAAPYYSYLGFVAGHPGMRPFVSSWIAATRMDRLRTISELERVKPRLALVTADSIDIPFSTGHPEEWSYIRAHYVLRARIGELEIYMRKGTLSGR